MMSKNYNVLIIGAGNIGAFFDTPDSEKILTHAHAFNSIEDFNLIGFVDVDYEKAKTAASIWNTEAYKNIKDAFIKYYIDVVCVCVPDDYHYEVLMEICNYKPKFVFAEKPLTKTLEQGEKILKVYSDKNIYGGINYIRRFVPEFKAVRKEIMEGKYGRFITGTGYYGKGVLHSGSHTIDFLRYMAGDISNITVLNHKTDFYKDDPSILLKVNFLSGGDCLLSVVDANICTVFEVDLIFEKKRFRVTDLGFKMELYEVQESKIYKGYKNLVKVYENSTSMERHMYYAAESIYEYLDKNKSFEASFLDGYKSMKVCIDAINMCQ